MFLEEFLLALIHSLWSPSPVLQNAHTMRYHIVEEVSLSELSIFQWKGKGVGGS
jgi:hypothetical protein